MPPSTRLPDANDSTNHTNGQDSSMLNWFQSNPVPPVSSEEKDWIEFRFNWLADHLGLQRLQTAELVLPTVDYFPGSFDGTDREIVDILQRIASYLDLNPDSIRFEHLDADRLAYDEFGNDVSTGKQTEDDPRLPVWLPSVPHNDPLGTVAVFTRKLTQVLLVGQYGVSATESDLRMLVDLATVYLGVGIVPANVAIYDGAGCQCSNEWAVERSASMSLNMFGYAFAIFALARSDYDRVWTKHLRPDVRAATKRGIRYIESTKDCGCRFAV